MPLPLAKHSTTTFSEKMYENIEKYQFKLKNAK